jgi:hypothetical protein
MRDPLVNSHAGEAGTFLDFSHSRPAAARFAAQSSFGVQLMRVRFKFELAGARPAG